MNDRFRQACAEIVTRGLAKNDAEIAKAVNLPKPNLSAILNSKPNRNATVQILSALCMAYGVNPAFLLPPWSREVFIRSNKRDMVRRKRLEIEQAKRELRILEQQ